MSFPTFSARQSRSRQSFSGIGLAWTIASSAVLANLMTGRPRTGRYGIPIQFNDYLRRDVGLGPVDEQFYWGRFK